MPRCTRKRAPWTACGARVKIKRRKHSSGSGAGGGTDGTRALLVSGQDVRSGRCCGGTACLLCSVTAPARRDGDRSVPWLHTSPHTRACACCCAPCGAVRLVRSLARARGVLSVAWEKSGHRVYRRSGALPGRHGSLMGMASATRKCG
jgi:hypothetical protein